MSYMYINRTNIFNIDNEFSYWNKNNVETVFSPNDIPTTSIREFSNHSTYKILQNASNYDGCFSDAFPDLKSRAVEILKDRSWSKVFPSVANAIIYTALATLPALCLASSVEEFKDQVFQKGIRLGMLGGVIATSAILPMKTWDNGKLKIHKLNFAIETQRKFLKAHGETIKANITKTIGDLNVQIQDFESKIESYHDSENKITNKAIKRSYKDQRINLQNILLDNQFALGELEAMMTFQAKLQRKEPSVQAENSVKEENIVVPAE